VARSRSSPAVAKFATTFVTMLATVVAGAAFGGGVHAAATGDVARLCAKKEELVHIVQKDFEDLADPTTHSTYEASKPEEEPSRLILDRKVDLNGDGNPELVFSDPGVAARDAQYLSWYVDCGGDDYYPLFSEYAADYEIGKAQGKGWKPIYFFNNLSPKKPSFTLVGKSTYRFDGSHYTLVKSEKVKRRIF
jgi:hypothetical protein